MGINEFKDGNDPLEKMGIGRKHIVEKWLNEHSVSYYKLDSEIIGKNKYIIVHLEEPQITIPFENQAEIEIPDYVKFRKV